MTSSQPDKPAPPDRRTARRFPAIGPHGQGRLKLGETFVNIEVFDESTSGLGVVVEGPCECEVGQTLLVQVGCDWFEARVAHVKLPEPLALEEVEADAAKPRMRLGLVRLRDVDISEIEPQVIDWLSWKNFQRLAVPLAPLGRPMAGTIAALAGALSVGLIVILAAEHSAPTIYVDGGQPAPKTVRKAVVASHESEPSLEFRVIAGQPRRSQRPVAPPNRPRASSQADLAVIEEPLKKASRALPAANPIPEHVVRRIRPELFLAPEIKQLLALTADQLESLRRIFEETLTAAGETSAAARDALLERGQRVLAVLTDDQRRVLVAHLAATSDAASAEAAPERAGEPAAEPAEEAIPIR